jgi:hypothetical protein
MKSYFRRTAVVVIAVALSLSLPTVATASVQALVREHGNKNHVVRIIQKIQKLFGISTNDDLPQPPIPTPPPPATTT